MVVGEMSKKTTTAIMTGGVTAGVIKKIMVVIGAGVGVGTQMEIATKKTTSQEKMQVLVEILKKMAINQIKVKIHAK